MKKLTAMQETAIAMIAEYIVADVRDCDFEDWDSFRSSMYIGKEDIIEYANEALDNNLYKDAWIDEMDFTLVTNDSDTDIKYASYSRLIYKKINELMNTEYNENYYED